MSFGQTLFDAEDLALFDAPDMLPFDADLPVSPVDAGTLPPWAPEGAGWPTSSDPLPQRYEISGTITGDVTAQYSTPGAMLTATLTAGMTPAQVRSTLIAAGFPVAAVSGSALGTGTLTVLLVDTVATASAFTATGGGASVTDASVTALYNNTTRPYRIKACNYNGAVLCEALAFFDGKWESNANEASRLEFSVLKTAATAHLIAELNDPIHRVKLYDARNLPLGTFRLYRPSFRRDGDAVVYRYSGIDSLAQLGKEVIPELRITGMRLIDAVKLALSYQANELPISLHEMSALIQYELVDLNLTNTTVLQALREMQAQLPFATAGYFYVGASGRDLHWVQEVGAHGKRIAIGERLRTIESNIDHDAVVSRLYVYGEGADTRNRLTLRDAGYPHEYLESLSAKTNYGTLSQATVETRLNTADALDRFARRAIDELSTPRHEYRVEAIDLARLGDPTAGGRSWTPDGTGGWAELYVGGAYLLSDADAGVSDVLVRIVSKSVSLDGSLSATIDLDNRSLTLSDIIAKLIGGQNPPVQVGYDEATGTTAERYPDIVSSLSDGTLADGRGNQVGPQPSGEEPQPVGLSASIGTGDDYERQGHTHAQQPDTLIAMDGQITALNETVYAATEELISLNNLGVTVTPDGEPVQALLYHLNGAVQDGTNTRRAYTDNLVSVSQGVTVDKDGTPIGITWVAKNGTTALLNALTDGGVGVDTATGYGYMRVSGALKRISPPAGTSADSKTNLLAVLQDGGIGEDTSDHTLYARAYGALVALGPLKAAGKTALLALLKDGQCGEDSQTNRGYQRLNGALICTSHWEA